jgi:hypothetical protein
MTESQTFRRLLSPGRASLDQEWAAAEEELGDQLLALEHAMDDLILKSPLELAQSKDVFALAVYLKWARLALLEILQRLGEQVAEALEVET